MSEREEKALRLGKNVNRLALLVGGLTVALPLVFWNRIPEKLPMHYGSDGMPDRIGEKSELVLLFFSILFLMGIMSITLYFIKTNLSSKHAKAQESQVNLLAYPMLAVLHLVMNAMFAYMMFCTVTLRKLGVLFLPVTLIATFLPIVGLLVKARKFRKDSGMTREKFEDAEKAEEGTGYRTKVDWWLGLLLLGSVAMCLYFPIVEFVREGKTDWLLIGTALLVLLIIGPMFSIRYVLYPKHLSVSCSIYGNERIPYEAIVNVKETHNPLSSMALSIDRIQIDYVIKGMQKTVLISPIRKQEFLEKLAYYREQKL